ncbi:D-2-hydroxyacid dehydrogenase [Allonocardiopsis opalescens]|uniref:Phosphoglycerate dehydrogenase-like enzyme n=1 Tax=Allonocardiopsis opalescens TaxID=1144618 RepID=A0A2T0PYD1_9ACTN|nr:D-2-hydroxyacid dehydrogenase [Allonocardiopsis opalescens]PRX96555.1 phosphoglycerate dehydrogenase-like enzyme [Allonocardiopsis opalescens]
MPSPSEEREIRSVLATVLYQPHEIDLLRAAFAPAEFVHLHPGDAEGIAEALEHADVAVLPIDLDDRFLKAPKLRWVHCDHSGLTRSARPEVFEKGLIVTGSAGRSAPALAQHGFFFALALTFDARRLLEKQAEHVWRGIPDYHHRLALWGKTLGIVGFGHTGREMAELGRAFGMRVVALRRQAGRTHPAVDLMLATDAGDSLDTLIAEADVIMLAAPLSDETYHLFSTEQFASMKDDAYIINMARGPVIDQDALIDALRTGQIAGAGLDVTDPEPLPAESPLWDLPNVIITPHMTPMLPDRTQRSIDMIVENIGRYRRGEPLLNALGPRDIFTRR